MAKQTQPIRHVWLTPADFLDDADFRSWDCKLCGAYWCLILVLYANGGRIPDDISQLRKLAQWHGSGFQKAWFTLRKKFQVRCGYVRHKRVSQELRRARKAQQDKRRAGLRSAESRQQTPNAPSTLLGEGKVRKGKEKNKALVSWKDNAFVVPDSVMAEFETRWPNITRAAIDQEILDCAAYHAERKTKIKSPKGRIVTWLKNAFDKFLQKETVVPKRRQGQNVAAVLGLEGAEVKK